MFFSGTKVSRWDNLDHHCYGTCPYRALWST